MELSQSCYCHALGIENGAYTADTNAVLCLLVSGNSCVLPSWRKKEQALEGWSKSKNQGET